MHLNNICFKAYSHWLQDCKWAQCVVLGTWGHPIDRCICLLWWGSSHYPLASPLTLHIFALAAFKICLLIRPFWLWCVIFFMFMLFGILLWFLYLWSDLSTTFGTLPVIFSIIFFHRFPLISVWGSKIQRCWGAWLPLDFEVLGCLVPQVTKDSPYFSPVSSSPPDTIFFHLLQVSYSLCIWFQSTINPIHYSSMLHMMSILWSCLLALWWVFL